MIYRLSYEVVITGIDNQRCQETTSTSSSQQQLQQQQGCLSLQMLVEDIKVYSEAKGKNFSFVSVHMA